jgi:membrane associated rhomboid family serine protease
MTRPYYREYTVGFGGGGVTYYVQILLLVNIAVFICQLLLEIPFGYALMPPGGTPVLEWLTYSTDRLFQGWIWLPFTYMFLHGGLSHLFFNMIQLYFFGPEVERTLGTRQFLRFYLFCGVMGALANVVAWAVWGSSAPVLGASGAILGVLVAFAVIDPDREIFLIPLPFPITARALIIFLVIINLLNAWSERSGIAVATHFGGMIAGYAYMKFRPLLLQQSWQRRGKNVRKAKSKTKDGSDGGESRLAEAIDNIFKFQGKDRR